MKENNIKNIVQREYTTPEIAKILGVTTRKVISMIERGHLTPSIQEAHGHASRRLFNFGDVVRAYITLELLNFGLAVDYMRIMTGLLQAHLDEPYFMINKSGEICLTSDDKRTADKHKLEFLNNPTAIPDSDGLPDSSPVLYISIRDMKYRVYKLVEKRL